MNDKYEHKNKLIPIRQMLSNFNNSMQIEDERLKSFNEMLEEKQSSIDDSKNKFDVIVDAAKTKIDDYVRNIQNLSQSKADLLNDMIETISEFDTEEINSLDDYFTAFSANTIPTNEKVYEDKIDKDVNDENLIIRANHINGNFINEIETNEDTCFKYYKEDINSYNNRLCVANLKNIVRFRITSDLKVIDFGLNVTSHHVTTAGLDEDGLNTVLTKDTMKGFATNSFAGRLFITNCQTENKPIEIKYVLYNSDFDKTEKVGPLMNFKVTVSEGWMYLELVRIQPKRFYPRKLYYGIEAEEYKYSLDEKDGFTDNLDILAYSEGKVINGETFNNYNAKYEDNIPFDIDLSLLQTSIQFTFLDLSLNVQKFDKNIELMDFDRYTSLVKVDPKEVEFDIKPNKYSIIKSSGFGLKTDDVSHIIPENKEMEFRNFEVERIDPTTIDPTKLPLWKDVGVFNRDLNAKSNKSDMTRRVFITGGDEKSSYFTVNVERNISELIFTNQYYDDILTYQNDDTGYYSNTIYNNLFTEGTLTDPMRMNSFFLHKKIKNVMICKINDKYSLFYRSTPYTSNEQKYFIFDNSDVHRDITASMPVNLKENKDVVGSINDNGHHTFEYFDKLGILSISRLTSSDSQVDRTDNPDTHSSLYFLDEKTMNFDKEEKRHNKTGYMLYWSANVMRDGSYLAKFSPNFQRGRITDYARDYNENFTFSLRYRHAISFINAEPDELGMGLNVSHVSWSTSNGGSMIESRSEIMLSRMRGSKINYVGKNRFSHVSMGDMLGFDLCYSHGTFTYSDGLSLMITNNLQQNYSRFWYSSVGNIGRYYIGRNGVLKLCNYGFGSHTNSGESADMLLDSNSYDVKYETRFNLITQSADKEKKYFSFPNNIKRFNPLHNDRFASSTTIQYPLTNNISTFDEADTSTSYGTLSSNDFYDKKNRVLYMKGLMYYYLHPIKLFSFISSYRLDKSDLSIYPFTKGSFDNREHIKESNRLEARYNTTVDTLTGDKKKQTYQEMIDFVKDEESNLSKHIPHVMQGGGYVVGSSGSSSNKLSKYSISPLLFDVETQASNGYQLNNLLNRLRDDIKVGSKRGNQFILEDYSTRKETYENKIQVQEYQEDGNPEYFAEETNDIMKHISNASSIPHPAQYPDGLGYYTEQERPDDQYTYKSYRIQDGLIYATDYSGVESLYDLNDSSGYEIYTFGNIFRYSEGATHNSADVSYQNGRIYYSNSSGYGGYPQVDEFFNSDKWTNPNGGRENDGRTQGYYPKHLASHLKIIDGYICKLDGTKYTGNKIFRNWDSSNSQQSMKNIKTPNDDYLSKSNLTIDSSNVILDNQINLLRYNKSDDSTKLLNVNMGSIEENYYTHNIITTPDSSIVLNSKFLSIFKNSFIDEYINLAGIDIDMENTNSSNKLTLLDGVEISDDKVLFIKLSDIFENLENNIGWEYFLKFKTIYYSNELSSRGYPKEILLFPTFLDLRLMEKNVFYIYINTEDNVVEKKDYPTVVGDIGHNDFIDVFDTLNMGTQPHRLFINKFSDNHFYMVSPKSGNMFKSVYPNSVSDWKYVKSKNKMTQFAYNDYRNSFITFNRTTPRDHFKYGVDSFVTIKEIPLTKTKVVDNNVKVKVLDELNKIYQKSQTNVLFQLEIITKVDHYRPIKKEPTREGLRNFDYIEEDGIEKVDREQFISSEEYIMIKEIGMFNGDGTSKIQRYLLNLLSGDPEPQYTNSTLTSMYHLANRTLLLDHEFLKDYVGYRNMKAFDSVSTPCENLESLLEQPTLIKLKIYPTNCSEFINIDYQYKDQKDIYTNEDGQVVTKFAKMNTFN